MFTLFFPSKCILCRSLLESNETDLCHDCRANAPELIRAKRNIPFVAHWTAVWYYKDDVRKSIHRFKFSNARSYADAYARLLALKVQQSFPQLPDIVTWVPVSLFRRMKRGYDQSQLVAKALAKELSLPIAPLLKKTRHTPPQSNIPNAAQRRANVFGAYKVFNQECIDGKKILLLDDVITTGATSSECARMLLTAGAKEIYFAAVAAASHDKNK